jgi:hypothetical protein
MLFLAQWLPACVTLRACIEAGSASHVAMLSLTVAGAAQFGSDRASIDGEPLFPV